MKKATLGIGALIIIIVLILVMWHKSSPTTSSTAPVSVDTSNPAASVPVTATTKVSDKLSVYQNAELGFSVKYPTAWEKDDTDTGVTFIMPIDSNQVSTVAKLQVDLGVGSGKCAFPPVVTVKDRGTLTVGSNTLNTISIANTNQGRGYFDRMYSLQKGDVCYIFRLSTITLSPESKNLTGSNIVQAQNNNKAIINTADTAFTDLVKSFTFVASATGVDESTVAPVKK